MTDRIFYYSEETFFHFCDPRTPPFRLNTQVFKNGDCLFTLGQRELIRRRFTSSLGLAWLLEKMSPTVGSSSMAKQSFRSDAFANLDREVVVAKEWKELYDGPGKISLLNYVRLTLAFFWICIKTCEQRSMLVNYLRYLKQSIVFFVLKKPNSTTTFLFQSIFWGF